MKLRRPSRSRRIAKWVAVSASVALASTLLFSLFPTVWFNSHIAGGGWQAQLGSGAIAILKKRESSSKVHDTYYVVIKGPPLYPIYETTAAGNIKSVIIIPMWLPVLVALVTTAILWRWDRRHPKGHCQACGHDITGADHVQCPECGILLPSPRQVVGRFARVIATVSPEGGRVAIDRHVWQARPAAGDFVVDKGAKVIVRAFRGRCLLVSPKSSGPTGPPLRRRFG